MAISFTLNPIPTIRLSASAPTVSMSITGNAVARFSTPLSIRWDSIVDPPAELSNIADLTTTGFITRTDSGGAISTRTLTAPAAGFTITNPAGVAGDPTFVLANDLAAYEGLSSTGLVVRTGDGTATTRTLTGPTFGIAVTNGNGISGNPTLALGDDLAALELLGSTGFAVRTATNTWAQRSLTAPAAGLTISNNDGVSGNPTFALADDLAALEALSGTNTIYYRSAASTWTAVTIGANLTFSAGTLSASGGGSVTGPGSSTDNAVVRFDGAGGATLQNSAFIVDDTGHVTSFGGNIKFPASQAASADANTLDDYEEGTWTPVLTAATPGDLSVTYAAQVGVYTKMGRLVVASFTITSSAFTHTTASGALQVTGLPFTSANVTNQNSIGGCFWGGITKATYTNIVSRNLANTAIVSFVASGSGVATSAVAITDCPTGGTMVLQATLFYVV
jgi:hypothetical protein